jgi:hypothetical protein
MQAFAGLNMLGDYCEASFIPRRNSDLDNSSPMPGSLTACLVLVKMREGLTTMFSI